MYPYIDHPEWREEDVQTRNVSRSGKHSNSGLFQNNEGSIQIGG